MKTETKEKPAASDNLNSLVRCSVGKMTHETKRFRKGQQIWLVQMTGSQAALVCGKRRGRWNYIKAWIKWDKPSKPWPDFKDVEVSEDFASRNGLLISPNDMAQPRREEG